MIALPILAIGCATQLAAVPFRMAENAILVDAKVNGHKLSLMLDTGFGGSVLADSNIDLGTPTGSLMLRDFVGEFKAHTVQIKSFSLGERTLDLPDKEAVLQPIAHISMAYNAHADGILGLQAIQGAVTEINFQKDELIFHPNSEDISIRKPDNKRTFLLKMSPVGMNSVELTAQTSSGQALHMSLDTGNSFYATTYREVLERVGLWQQGKKAKFFKPSFVASGETESWEKKMVGMTVFGVPVPTSYWDILDQPAASASSDGTVGIRFLKNFNITLDYTRRRVWLENFTGVVENEPEGEVGLVATGSRRSGNGSIVEITPAGPADKAGLKVGDEVLEVDGHEVTGAMTYRQISALINGKPGSKVTIAVSRHGDLIRCELERVPLYNE